MRAGQGRSGFPLGLCRRAGVRGMEVARHIERPMRHGSEPVSAFQNFVEKTISTINVALADVPRDRVRLHQSNEGRHPRRDLLGERGRHLVGAGDLAVDAGDALGLHRRRELLQVADVGLAQRARRRDDRSDDLEVEAAAMHRDTHYDPTIFGIDLSEPFILGVVPLLRASGAGAEMRQALGTAVFYGMLGVTFFGLLLTPVFYLVIRAVTEAR